MKESELAGLVEAGILSEETAERIREFHRQNKAFRKDRVALLLAVLGAALLGLGIILLFAANWRRLGKTARLALAFLPLLTGQGLCLYTLLRKEDSPVWREASSTFLFLAVGAALALVGQVYHTGGYLASFLALWMLLGLPLVYLMRSGTTALLYLAGISFTTRPGVFSYLGFFAYLVFPLLFLAILPFLLKAWKERPKGAFTLASTWVLAASFLWALGEPATAARDSLFLGVVQTLFSAFLLLGFLGPFREIKGARNGLLFLGNSGTLLLFLFVTALKFPEWALSPEKGFFTRFPFQAALWGFTTLAALLLLALFLFQRSPQDLPPFALAFLLLDALLLFPPSPPVRTSLLCAFLFLSGFRLSYTGAMKGKQGLLAQGLLVMITAAALVFFMDFLPFAVRGAAFLFAGGLCLAPVFLFRKKRKIHA